MYIYIYIYIYVYVYIYVYTHTLKTSSRSRREDPPARDGSREVEVNRGELRSCEVVSGELTRLVTALPSVAQARFAGRL